MGNAKEAANALYMAASHASRDPAAWIRAARMARDIGFEEQALRCFDEYPARLDGVDGRGVRLDSSDMNVLYERSVMHAQYGRKRKVCDFAGGVDGVGCRWIQGDIEETSDGYDCDEGPRKSIPWRTPYR